MTDASRPIDPDEVAGIPWAMHLVIRSDTAEREAWWAENVTR